ncbi:hypothetical protein DL93DRAFT_1362736 [Clavulina sp. PMI_390]|nr:hypothetical protein DL93DRAFT_1362736 [Clavulina sp. PMI_390]
MLGFIVFAIHQIAEANCGPEILGSISGVVPAMLDAGRCLGVDGDSVDSFCDVIIRQHLSYGSSPFSSDGILPWIIEMLDLPYPRWPGTLLDIIAFAIANIPEADMLGDQDRESLFGGGLPRLLLVWIQNHPTTLYNVRQENPQNPPIARWCSIPRKALHILDQLSTSTFVAHPILPAESLNVIANVIFDDKWVLLSIPSFSC